jgi:glucose-1-phosphate thymidylyltransferase
MQVIIPVAGAGTKLRPHTYTQPKVLMSVAGKPILSYIIEELLAVGVNRFVFVIGYLGEKIKEFVQKEYPDLETIFVEQGSSEGLGHAVFCAKNAIDMKSPLIIQLGDTILDADFKSILSSDHSTLCVKKVEDPRQFGVAEINPDLTIKSLVEKPQIPRSNMALVGFYFIKETQKLFDALYQNMSENKRDNEEFYLTNGLQRMINEGVVFQSYKVEHWFDVGKKDILLKTNEILLKRKPQYSEIKNIWPDTVIIPPCHIDQSAVLKNTVIGPNTSVGANTIIKNSIVKDSIIGSFAKVENVVLSNSLIGSDSMIMGMSQSLNIGDNTELDLRGDAT